jgi:hypothetical protein
VIPRRTYSESVRTVTWQARLRARSHCSSELHSIVGRVRHTSLEHALMFTAPKDARPTARTGIP